MSRPSCGDIIPPIAVVEFLEWELRHKDEDSDIFSVRNHSNKRDHFYMYNSTLHFCLIAHISELNNALAQKILHRI